MNLADLSLEKAPLIKTTPPGKRSKKYLDYQKKYESSTISYAKNMPMAILRGKGATIEDMDGNIYIDLFGGAGVMAVGYSNPIVLESAKKQIDQITHTLDIPHPKRIELVELLFQILPKDINKIFFGGPTGSDAVEQAIKLARYNTHRIPFIAFQGGYHGMTAGALGLTSATPHKENLLPLMSDIHFAPFAYCYRCLFKKVPKSCDLECAQYLEHMLDDPHSGVAKPAAIIVESIQGEGGSIVPPLQFIPRVREICNDNDVLMVADEIQSGLGRTGKMFSFEHTNIVPDIVTMSKALGGLGFPISAIAYRESLNTLPTGKTIGTFRGNMIAFAAGVAAIKFIRDNNLPEHALNLGNKVLSILKEAERESKIVGDARGKGLMLGIEFVIDKKKKTPNSEIAKKVRTLCHKKGVLIEIGGHYGNVARFLPPLIITEELMLKGVEIFLEVIKKIEKKTT